MPPAVRIGRRYMLDTARRLASLRSAAPACARIVSP